MGCSECKRKRKSAAAKMAASRSVKSLTSNDFGLASLQTVLADMEGKLLGGAAYKDQWIRKLNRKRHHLNRVYPDRIGAFDRYVQAMPDASVKQLSESISAFKTITGTNEQYIYSG